MNNKFFQFLGLTKKAGNLLKVTINVKMRCHMEEEPL